MSDIDVSRTREAMLALGVAEWNHVPDIAPYREAVEAAARQDCRAAQEPLAEALRIAAPDLCSMRCPSVKKTGTLSIHTPRCDSVNAALAAYDALGGE